MEGFTEDVTLELVCFKTMYLRDSAGGLVVKSLPRNGGDTSLIPGQGPEIPQALEQPLSPRTLEPTCHR